MSKKLFTESEIKILSKNKNVLKVSTKSIVYALEFKEKFIGKYSKGKLPRVILKKMDLMLKLLG